MKIIKIFLLSLVLSAHIGFVVADEMTADEIKAFRTDFININKNKFLDLEELQTKSQNDIKYKVLLWHQLVNPKSEKTFTDIATFIQENPDFPKRYELEKQAENLITSDIDKKVLKDWFEESKPRTINGIGEYIKLLDEDKVPEYIRKTWIESDFSPSEDSEYYNTFKSHLNKQDVVNKIDELLWNGKTNNASRLLKYVSSDYKKLFNARIGLRKRYRNVTSLINAVPESLKNDEGLVFERIKWRRRKGRYTDAIKLLETEHSHHTHHEEWWQERIVLVRYKLKEKQYQQAYDLTIKGNNTSPIILAENQWLAGWIAYRFLNRPDIALGHFLAMRESVSSFISKARGDYWIARCYEEVQDVSRAWKYYNYAAQYTTTFYGQMAIETANIEVDDIFKNKADISNWGYNRYKKRDLIQGIKFLSDLNLKNTMNTFALRAFYEAEDDDEDYVAALVKFMREIKRDEMAVLLARRARTAGIEVGESGYPILDDIKYPKDPDKPLIHAVIRQESGFDAKAKSPVGARGLMQIMPATARNLSQWKRLRYSLKRLTSDVNYNVTLGEYYLWRLLRQHKGSYYQTFAAYNAGAGNVRKWNREFAKHKAINPKLDEIDWIETIPYDETRNYVQRVQENYYIYKHIFKGEKTE